MLDCWYETSKGEQDRECLSPYKTMLHSAQYAVILTTLLNLAGNFLVYLIPALNLPTLTVSFMYPYVPHI